MQQMKITANELKRYFELSMIETVILRRLDRDDPDYPIRWEIWVKSWDNMPCGRIDGLLVNSSRGMFGKVYTSLDRAYLAIKNLGFDGNFEIDG